MHFSVGGQLVHSEHVLQFPRYVANEFGSGGGFVSKGAEHIGHG
jgi:hypothetical protein